ncbi:helix-turn-helix transcriptional regulator [Mycolicibacterium neoaurum]|uniref:helix-turn-helix domain-containing protein n=1 Tax=Mycolicibacterium neoaurum TaxID=1795 RepID=UPI002671C827|nr:helix-turn-helix transcriptional regulator [Mycolicibacterium neoaurum]MDO3401926.1 helix-turn-helix transcriptional regulator [Mycolicibacterium neoaurum]
MKEVRLALGFSQVQVTERMRDHGVEITDAGLSNIENGNKKASDRVLIAWAKALGIEPLNVWHGPLRPQIEPPKPPHRNRVEQVPA